jgi:hypothetical protein
MKKIFHIYLPSIRKYTIDFRRWYYVYIGGERMSWWCLGCEMKDILMDYPDSRVKFAKIPFCKTLLH